MYDYRRGESILAAFLLGGIVGAVLGLLFSPRSGKENREFIAAKAEEYWARARSSTRRAGRAWLMRPRSFARRSTRPATG